MSNSESEPGEKGSETPSAMTEGSEQPVANKMDDRYLAEQQLDSNMKIQKSDIPMFVLK